MAVATKRDPAKWARAKARAKAKMGGKHSARAMQLATKYYKDAGGGYVGKKKKSNKKPKKFTGGELFFPEYNYELTCDDNSLIMFPGWVEHGVKKVSIKDSDYHEGNGRYCISSFINNVGR